MHILQRQPPAGGEITCGAASSAAAATSSPTNIKAEFSNPIFYVSQCFSKNNSRTNFSRVHIKKRFFGKRFMFAQCALHAHILDLIQCMKVFPRAEYLRNVLWATRWIQCCYVSHSVFPTNNFGDCALLEHSFRFMFIFWLSLIFLPCFEPQNFISPPAPPFWMADQVDEAGTHLPLGRAPNTSTHV